MARKVTVALVDDLDGGPADETVEIVLDGVAYEIDLSSANAARLRRELQDWIGAARPVGRRSKSGSGEAARGSLAMRAWARQHGYALGERGRIPAGIVAAYHAAHPSQ